MKRIWKLTGVPRPGFGQFLSDTTRSHIATILTPRFSRISIDAFLNDVDTAVFGYAGLRDLHDRTRPAKCRENIHRAFDAAMTLNARINDLDDLSLHFVGSAQDSSLLEFRDSLALVIKRLGEARTMANELPTNAGRLPDQPRLQLAAYVAYALRKHLGVEPTTTRNGLYFEIMIVVMRFVLGRERDNDFEPSVSDLMRRALRVPVVEHPDGVIEFDLSSD